MKEVNVHITALGLRVWRAEQAPVNLVDIDWKCLLSNSSEGSLLISLFSLFPSFQHRHILL